MENSGENGQIPYFEHFLQNDDFWGSLHVFTEKKTKKSTNYACNCVFELAKHQMLHQKCFGMIWEHFCPNIASKTRFWA